MNKFLKGTFLSVLALLILCVAAVPAAAADLNADTSLVLSDSAATEAYLIDVLSEELTVFDAAVVYDLACLEADCTAVAGRFAVAAGAALEEGSGVVLSYDSPSFSYTALAALAMLETGILPENIAIADIAASLKTMEVDFSAENPYSLVRILDLTEKYPSFFGDSNDSVRETIKTTLMGYFKTGEVSGFDYYGLSTDTNATMILGLLSFADTDETVSEALEAAFSYLASQKTETGYNFSAEYPGVNASSTALALAAYAKAGKIEEASAAFLMLRKFQSKATPGAYLYGEEDSYFSTADALRSLAAYKEALAAADTVTPTEVPVPTTVPNPETGARAETFYTFGSLGIMLMIVASAVYTRRDNGKQNESL